MHELGIVMHVAKVLDEAAEENHITKIGSVTLEIGEVSGIMLDYFEECRKVYPTVQYGKICPYCQSEHTYLLQGNECNIKEIEAETEE